MFINMYTYIILYTLQRYIGIKSLRNIYGHSKVTCLTFFIFSIYRSHLLITFPRTIFPFLRYSTRSRCSYAEFLIIFFSICFLSISCTFSVVMLCLSNLFFHAYNFQTLPVYFPSIT